MGAKPSEFAWRARKGADGGARTRRGQPGGTRARGRCERYGRTARPARGTRVGSLAAQGAGVGSPQPGGTRARWARGRCGRAACLPSRPTCPYDPDTPQRVWLPADALRAHAQPPPTHPSAHPPPRRALSFPASTGGGVRLPSAHPPLEASPAPWRAPGEHPRRAPNPRRVWLPADALRAHAQPSPAPQRAPGSPTRTQLPSEYPGGCVRLPSAHPAQHAPGPARARLPDAHLASTRPTTFWPFSSRFTQPGAFRNAILAIFAMLYVETSLRHA